MSDWECFCDKVPFLISHYYVLHFDVKLTPRCYIQKIMILRRIRVLTKVTFKSLLDTPLLYQNQVNWNFSPIAVMVWFCNSHDLIFWKVL